MSAKLCYFNVSSFNYYPIHLYYCAKCGKKTILDQSDPPLGVM